MIHLHMQLEMCILIKMLMLHVLVFDTHVNQTESILAIIGIMLFAMNQNDIIKEK